jgi:hypothetical protein
METALVVLNMSEERQDVSVEIGSERPWRDIGLHELIGNKEVKHKGNPEPLGIEPFGGHILKVE